MGLRDAMGREPRTDWKRNRKMVREGFQDLAYLPRSRRGWNATLSAYAYSFRRKVAGAADLNLWAAMHGCPASARYRDLGDHALVLWHGTTDERARRIAEVGLFHKRGVWAALNPQIAHGYTRGRSIACQAGSAAVVLVVDGTQVLPGLHYDQETPDIVRFRTNVPPGWVEYILWDDRTEFVGERKAGEPKPWGVAHFKKKEGQWVPRSHPPVRFDEEHAYSTLEEWLHLSVERILATLRACAAIEVFSSLYATIDPWDALTHEDVFTTLEQLCAVPRRRRGTRLFALASRDER